MEKLARLSEQISTKPVKADYSYISALYSSWKGDIENADVHFKNAVKYFRELHYEYELQRTARQYREFLKNSGKTPDEMSLLTID